MHVDEIYKIMLKKVLGYFFFFHLRKNGRKKYEPLRSLGRGGGFPDPNIFFLHVFTYLGVCICRDYGEGHEGHHQEDKH